MSLYGVNVVAGASAGFLLVMDQAFTPSDGAVAPIYCMPVAANQGLLLDFSTPIAFGNGITLVFSTTGCFTKTGSATAFLAASYR